MKIMLRVTVSLVVLAVAASLLSGAIGSYRQQKLVARQKEVQQINEQRDQEYAVALAEFSRYYITF